MGGLLQPFSTQNGLCGLEHVCVDVLAHREINELASKCPARLGDVGMLGHSSLNLPPIVHIAMSPHLAIIASAQRCVCCGSARQSRAIDSPFADPGFDSSNANRHIVDWAFKVAGTRRSQGETRREPSASLAPTRRRSET